MEIKPKSALRAGTKKNINRHFHRSRQKSLYCSNNSWKLSAIFSTIRKFATSSSSQYELVSVYANVSYRVMCKRNKKKVQEVVDARDIFSLLYFILLLGRKETRGKKISNICTWAKAPRRVDMTFGRRECNKSDVF